jgi:hypothetical protein
VARQRERRVATYQRRRIVEKWTEEDTLDEGVHIENQGYWTAGMSGYPRKTIEEVRAWIDEQGEEVK